MKTIHAKLKNPIEAAVQVDSLDFNENFIQASAVVERLKKNLLHEVRQKMHERVAELSLDDIDFKIL